MNPINSIAASSVDPAVMQSALASSKTSQQQKAAQVGEQFEAIFVRQYLGESLKPLLKGGALDEGGAANETYRYFLTDMLATRLASQHAFGIGQTVQAQLAPKTATVDTQAASTQAATQSGSSQSQGSKISAR